MSAQAANPPIEPQSQTNPRTNTSNRETNPEADLATSLLSSTKHTKPTQTSTNSSSTGNEQTQTDPSTARAMSHTGAWKPALDRSQSWDAQEYKHNLLKRQYMAGAAPGKGFSEV